MNVGSSTQFQKALRVGDPKAWLDNNYFFGHCRIGGEDVCREI